MGSEDTSRRDVDVTNWLMQFRGMYFSNASEVSNCLHLGLLLMQSIVHDEFVTEFGVLDNKINIFKCCALRVGPPSKR